MKTKELLDYHFESNFINKNNVSDKDKMNNSIEDASHDRGTKLLVMKATSRQSESYSKTI